MTSTPDKVFTDAVKHLDERQGQDTVPDPHRLDENTLGQPLEGSGYVYAQVGWLDTDGAAYGLRLPHNLYANGVGLRPLYLCLGRHETQIPEGCG
jgi:hypothetical protein